MLQHFLLKEHVLCWTSITFLLFGKNSAGTASSMYWGYKEAMFEVPPAKWQADFPMCNGTRQSPIAINTSQIEYDSSLQAIQFVQYDQHPVNNAWTVLDNGHVVQINFSTAFPDSVQAPVIQAGGLEGTYKLLQFHFHWGSEDWRGSEHVIDGNRFPLELHLVHRKSTDNEISAATDSTGLAVVAVLFQLAEPDQTTSADLDLLSRAVQLAVDPQLPIQVLLPDFKLSNILPKSGDFYRYLGSLTTPPCSEDVVWSVMKERMKITEKQLNIFRQLRQQSNNSVDFLSDNFRPLQRDNGRVIKAYQSIPTISKKKLLVTKAGSQSVKGAASSNAIVLSSSEASTFHRSSLFPLFLFLFSGLQLF